MRDMRLRLISRLPIFLLCISLCSLATAQQESSSSQSSTSPASRGRSQAKARPEVEQQRQQAQQQAQSTLDKDAVTAITETQNAIKAIADNKPDQALASIERASGKIHVLTARNPATALLPVDSEIVVIDSAPVDVEAIRERARAAKKAMDDKDYPTARVILESLASEIRVRTYHLPLATYPDALKQAARLLDQKKTQEANQVLATALSTLVIVDRVKPLPILIAKASVDAANNIRQKDKDTALKLLSVAHGELDRAKELGYAGNDPEYLAVDTMINDVEKQVKSNGDAKTVFASLRQKVDQLFKKQSESPRK
jgi:hypothetical protein